jgi:hypothetical protein
LINTKRKLVPSILACSRVTIIFQQLCYLVKLVEHVDPNPSIEPCCFQYPHVVSLEESLRNLKLC